MTQQNQFYCNSGFLPSVKLKLLSKSCGKREQERKRIMKERLNINQNPEQKKNVPQLIEDYYKRFKMQAERVSPLSVSINFKTIAHEQIQRLNMKNKEQKMRLGTISNKNRSYSEGSYSIKLHTKKPEFDKNNFVARNILKNLKKISFLQQNSSVQLKVKNKISQTQKVKKYVLLQNINSQTNTKNHLNEQQNKQAHYQQQINRQSYSKYQNYDWTLGLKFKNLKMLQGEGQNGMSSYATLNAKKKYRNHTKIMQQFGSTHKNLTPWINHCMHSNTEQQTLQILKKSLQLAE